MKQINQRLITIVLGLSLLNSNALSQEKTQPGVSPSTTPKVTCNQVIEACDKALAKKDQDLKDTNAALNKSIENSSLLQKQLSDQKEKEGSFLKNPFFWLLVGVIGGLVGGHSLEH